MAAKKVAKKEGTKTYVGNRINDRQYKRWLAGARDAAERRAIKSFVLGEDFVYYGKEQQDGGEA